MKILKTSIYASCAIAMLAIVGCDRGRNNPLNPTNTNASVTSKGTAGVPTPGTISSSTQVGGNVSFNLTPTAGGGVEPVVSYGGNTGQFPNGGTYNFIPVGSMFLDGFVPVNPNIAGQAGDNSIFYLTNGNESTATDVSGDFTDKVVSKVNRAFQPSVRFGFKLINFTVNGGNTGNTKVGQFVVIGSTNAAGVPNTPDSASVVLPATGQTLTNANVTMNFSSTNPAVTTATNATLTVRYNNGSTFTKTVPVTTPTTIINKLGAPNNVVINTIERVEFKVGN